MKGAPAIFIGSLALPASIIGHLSTEIFVKVIAAQEFPGQHTVVSKIHLANREAQEEIAGLFGLKITG